MPVTPEQKVDLEWALSTILSRAKDYKLARDYYDGHHRLAFATTNWRNEFGALFSAFSDNLCPAVIAAVKNRLAVVGFSALDEEQAEGGPRQVVRQSRPRTDRVGGDDGPADLAWDLWDDQRMDRRQKEVHLEALRGGASYIIVWPDPDDENEPAFYLNRADRVCVRYDDERPGTIDLAAKVWIEKSKHARVNLYYDDRIEKFRTVSTLSGGLPRKADTFEPYNPDEEDGGEVIPHALDVVPVVPFTYDAVTGEPGRSRLTDVIPIQDALNKSVADMLVAMEFHSIPQRWIVGLQTQTDPMTGKVIPPFVPGADRIWNIPDPNAKLGQFEAANLAQFITVSDSFRAETARISGTPLHYLLLSGTFPSGEALRAAEAPLEAVVSDTRDSFGSSWEDAFAIGGRIRSGSDWNLSTVWRETVSRGEKEHAEAVQIKRDLGASRKQILRELGYSDAQIDAMDEEEAEEKIAKESQFDAGLGEGAEEPTAALARLAERPKVGTERVTRIRRNATDGSMEIVES